MMLFAATDEVTVTVAVFPIPAAVRVIWAVPGASPVTSPFAETAATMGLLVNQRCASAVDTRPCASYAAPLSCKVEPTATLPVAGVMSTRVIVPPLAGVTVTLEVAVFPAVVTVIVAEPGLWAIMRPVLLTETTDGALLVKLNVAPGTGTLAAS